MSVIDTDKIDAMSTVERVQRLTQLHMAKDTIKREIEDQFRVAASEIQAEIGYICGLLGGG